MKQYLLVPEDLYNRLEAHLDDPPDNRKDRGLTAVLHDKKLDTTARKELYSQNLNAHIENLREARARPLTVQTYVPPKKPSPNIHLFQNPYYNFVETPTPPATPVNIQPFRFQQQTLSAMQTPNPHVYRSLQAMRHPHPRNAAHLPTCAEEIDRLAQDILETLKHSADIYRIGENDTIMDPNKDRVLKGSKPGDALVAIRKLLGANVIHEPTGYQAFIKKLTNTDDSNNLLRQARSRIVQSGRGWLVSRKAYKKSKSKKKSAKRTKKSARKSKKKPSRKPLVKRWGK